MLNPPITDNEELDAYLYQIYEFVNDQLATPSTLSTVGYLVSGLPDGVVGDRTYVTDALAPSYGSAVVGGGAVVTPVFKNSTTWIVA